MGLGPRDLHVQYQDFLRLELVPALELNPPGIDIDALGFAEPLLIAELVFQGEVGVDPQGCPSFRRDGDETLVFQGEPLPVRDGLYQGRDSRRRAALPGRRSGRRLDPGGPSGLLAAIGRGERPRGSAGSG